MGIERYHETLPTGCEGYRKALQLNIWIHEGDKKFNMTTPRISITASDYNQKMDKIIAEGNDRGWDIDQTLIALLDEANKYTIQRKVVRKGNRKGGQRG